MKYDELIQNAQKEYDEATDEDKSQKEAALTALKDARPQVQEDLNAVGKSERENEHNRWSNKMGMDFETMSEEWDAVQNMASELTPEDAGSGDTNEGEEGQSASARGEESAPLSQLRSVVDQQQQQLEAERERTTGLSQKLHAKEVEAGLKDALREKGLIEGRFDSARKLTTENEMIQTLMDGKPLEPDTFTKAANSLYESVPELFSSSSNGENGNGSGEDQTIGNSGLKLRSESERSAGIPPTPTGNGSSELTDAQRAERTSNVY